MRHYRLRENVGLSPGVTLENYLEYCRRTIGRVLHVRYRNGVVPRNANANIHLMRRNVTIRLAVHRAKRESRTYAIIITIVVTHYHVLN